MTDPIQNILSLEAAIAYRQAARLAPQSADFAAREAEALTFAADGQVTPEARRGFKQGHVMTWTKEPCGGQTGYATADNGDPAALRGQGIKGHVFSIGFHELTR